MINVATNLTGDLAGDLDKFAKNVSEKVLFSGVAAMAKVLYDEVKVETLKLKSEKEHWFYGSSFKKTGQKYLFQPGTLNASVYRVYSPEKSTEVSKLYKISWNHTKCPYGYMVEFGTSKASAHSFMRPAFDHVQEAIAAGKTRMAEAITQL